MKKFSKLLITALAAIFSMTACQTEDPGTDVCGKMTSVSIGVNAEDMQQTKSLTSAEEIEGYHLRYILEVWTQGTNPECYTRSIEAADENQQATFNLTLLAGRTFDFLLWADYVKDGLEDNVDLHYTTTNSLKRITKQAAQVTTGETTDSKYANTRDAFFAREEVTVTPNFSKTITLHRAVAQLNIYTNDYLSVPTEFRPDYTSIAMPDAPEGFNVLTGQPFGASVTEKTVKVAVDMNPVEGKGYKMFTSYYFTSASTKSLTNFDVNFHKTGNSTPLTKYRMELIPMQQNYRTNIIGALLTNTGSLTVQTDATFNDPDIDISVPNNPLPSASGLYYSLDGESWTAWENDSMPDGNYTTFLAATVGTDKSYMLNLNKMQAIAQKTELQIIDLSRTEWDGSTFGQNMFKDHLNLREFLCPKDLKEIQSYMFKGCSNLRNVELPDGMVSIGIGGFQDCVSLTNIVLPNSLTKIGAMAFQGCKNLETINLDHVTTYNLIDNTSYAFANCHKLNIDVTLPTGIIEIPGYIFSGCHSISKVTLPSDTQSIGAFAFSDCRSLTTIDIPDKVSALGQHAFGGSGLTSVELPESLTEIPTEAFTGCKNLATVNLHDKITKIKANAFSKTAITSLTIPASVTTYGNVAFAYINTLEEVDITGSNSDLNIDAVGVFFTCKNLKTIKFPANTKSFQRRTLMGCENLSDIFCYASTPPKTANSDFGEYDSGSNEILFAGMNVPKAERKLHVPSASVESYNAPTLEDGTENYWKTILIDKLHYTIVPIE